MLRVSPGSYVWVECNVTGRDPVPEGLVGTFDVYQTEIRSGPEVVWRGKVDQKDLRNNHRPLGSNFMKMRLEEQLLNDTLELSYIGEAVVNITVNLNDMNVLPA